MPRPKKEGAAPPKTRSRFGCWPCKTRKVKCGEEKPICKNCQRQGEKCDYSIRLNWDARSRTKSDGWMTTVSSLPNTPSTIVFPSPEVFSGTSTPNPGASSFTAEARKAVGRHGRSRSNVSTPVRDIWEGDAVPQRQKLGSASPNLPSLDTSAQNEGQQGFSGVFSNHRVALSESRPQHLSPAWASNSMSSGGASIGNNTFGDADAPLFPSYSQANPTSASTAMIHGDGHLSTADRSKRVRLSGPADVTGLAPEVPFENRLDTSAPISPTRMSKSPMFGLIHQQSLPDTPGSAVSNGSTDQSTIFGSLGLDSRRASVPISSLLDRSRSHSESQDKRQIEFKADPCQSFGYDRGWPDLDVPKHDDSNALVASPELTDSSLPYHYHPVKIDFDDYYKTPVRIDIPISLIPLPSQLSSNPMNLLYFHHFLNHTARILTPHDCPANPYRTVLPRMAVQDEDLLNLLLAYSACHRAMLLSHDPPATRIANWAQNVFPKLLHGIQNPTSLSLNTIATSIIFASLEIISPAGAALGITIPWRSYLKSTCEMFKARTKYQPNQYFNEESFFVCRWFGYLDIIGSLSGPQSDAPLDFAQYWVEDPNEGAAGVDCFYGCTMQGMKMLGQVAQLVKEAQPFRLDENARVRDNWSPPQDVKSRANDLLGRLIGSLDQPVYTCPHDQALMSPGSHESRKQDLKELETTNVLYHWAGIIQLRRRVLNYAPDSFEVRNAVNSVLANLDKIREGSPAEACLLFAIFTAGCEASDADQREKFKTRLKDIEGFGLKQVIRAKELIERVWQESENWENLVTDEFIG